MINKPKSIPRPVRALAARLKEWSTVDDAFVDFGETKPEEVRVWAERFYNERPPDHSFRREWEKGEPHREAVWANWERLRGKTMRQRNEESTARETARIRAKYPLFADSPELLAQIGIRYPDSEEHYLAWRKKREETVAERYATGKPREMFSASAYAAARINRDEAMTVGGMSMNQARVWRWLHGFDGFTPCIENAVAELLTLGEENVLRNWEIIYNFAIQLWEKSEQERVQFAEFGPGGKLTKSWPQFRAWLERDWPAVQQMNQKIIAEYNIERCNYD